jgi:hypothetical protein
MEQQETRAIDEGGNTYGKTVNVGYVQLNAGRIGMM